MTGAGRALRRKTLRRGAACALIAFAFAFALTNRAAAQELWRGLPLGASVNSVRQAFPDAAPPSAVATLADGETDDLVTHGLFFDDRLMEVRFFFRDGLLTALQLTPATLGRSREDLSFARDMSARLTARYGRAFDCGDQSDADVGLYECKWLDGPIIVRLSYLDVEGQAPSLQITYRKADDAAYDF